MYNNLTQVTNLRQVSIPTNKLIIEKLLAKIGFLLVTQSTDSDGI
jgi:hypothetical protein